MFYDPAMDLWRRSRRREIKGAHEKRPENGKCEPFVVASSSSSFTEVRWNVEGNHLAPAIQQFQSGADLSRGNNGQYEKVITRKGMK